MNIFVPGRICLFGEHSDWAGGYRRINPALEKGYAIICGTNQGIYARVSAHPTALNLTATTSDGARIGPYQIPMQAEALLAEGKKGGFWSYIAGVAYQVQMRYPVGGLNIENYRTDLPIQKGLSSSAAACVLTARALNQIYSLGLTIREEMELAYLGEITTPSRCGRMDQGCAFGSRPILMTFDGDHLLTEEIKLRQPLYFVLTDLQARKNTLKILERLNRCYPFAQDEQQKNVHTLLGPVNRRIIHQAVEALSCGDAQAIGRLMVEAQQLFDRCAAPLCPEELTAPVLHRALNHPALQDHVWGGKGVGSQGDGAAQWITRSASDQDRVIHILEEQLGLPALRLTIEPE